ncbi:hypothetical protein DYB32_008464 [Aphanomyces invadans]|uniref:Histone deacetylase domain-containing protein n=1 Tax=Aphanomyces invadans TaxID=157072 RepID=A0A3R7CVJ1_9STRA|nr:hypothetical protein DYB32_008464 [Aphanomyces invadans]
MADAKQDDPAPATNRESDGEYEDGGSSASMFAEFWMHDLVELGNVDVLKAALDEDEEGFLVSLKEIDDMGCTPLHTAVLHPVQSVLSYLWSFGADALSLDTACNGTPTLHLVLRMCTFAEHRGILLPFLRDLLKCETFMESATHTKDDVGNTIFHVAAMANVVDVLELLDPPATALEVRNRVSERPVHVAIKFRSLDVLRALVHDHHVDVTAPTSFGVTPLHQAAASPAASTILPMLDPDWRTSTCKNGLNETPLDVFNAAERHRIPATDSRTCAFLYHPDAMEHLPMAGHVRGKDEPPPENYERMKSLVLPGLGILRTTEFTNTPELHPVQWDHDIPKADIADVLRIHDVAYVEKLKGLCGRIPPDVRPLPIPINPHGIHKVAIVDFDVHHGNGTEECIRHLVHRVQDHSFETPFVSGTHRTHQYKPWRSADDAANVFFCSVHGYGPKDPKQEYPPGQFAGAWFYPGSGESTPILNLGELAAPSEPLVVNVGLPYQRGNLARQEWRRVFRSDILPQVVAFQPDIIFLSAGFDGHRSENVNWGCVSSGPFESRADDGCAAM